ncbi:hypothetical protein A2U01_0084693, partial [Trifolium medium]|nr:hypothetical protein [Trifolium medium]
LGKAELAVPPARPNKLN